MEELKTLKELFDAGYLNQNEYDTRRIAIINRMTGMPAASAPANPTPAPAAVASKPTAQPVPAAQDLIWDELDEIVNTGISESNTIATHSSTLKPTTAYNPAPQQKGGAQILEEITDDSIWDELDQLANVGLPQATISSNPSTAPTLRNPAPANDMWNELNMLSNVGAPNSVSTLRAPTSSTQSTLRAPLQSTAAYNSAPATVGYQQSMGLQPTASFQSGGQSTIRGLAPQSTLQPTNMYGQQQQQQQQYIAYPQQGHAGAPLQPTNMYGQAMQPGMYDPSMNYTNPNPYSQRPQQHLQQPPMQQQTLRSAAPDRPSEFSQTPSLQSNAMVARASSKTAMMDQVSKGRGQAGTPYTWELFHSAQNNNVKRLNELIEMGVDVNQRDTDSGNSALHLACSRGQKHAIYFLVDQGINIDIQNKKGQTALHMLVTNRFNNLAVWLVRQGADIDIEDGRGFTPYDMALPWLQKEMKEAMYGRTRTAKTQQQINRVFGEMAEDDHPELRAEANFAKAQALGVSADTLSRAGGQQAAAQVSATPASAVNFGFAPDELDEMLGGANAAATIRPKAQTQSSAPVKTEVIKVYLKNGSYKSIMLTSETKVGDVSSMMAEKIHLEEHTNSFDLVEQIRDKARRLDPNANVMKIKANWPVILSKSGNETDKHCRFVLLPKRGCSEAVQKQYRRAQNNA